MLHAAGDAAAPRTAERAVHGGDEADRDAAPAAWVASANTAVPRRIGPLLAVGPGQRPRIAGVHRDDRQVGVDAHDPAGLAATVGEDHGHLVAAQVVGVGGHPPVGEDDAGAAARATWASAVPA